MLLRIVSIFRMTSSVHILTLVLLMSGMGASAQVIEDTRQQNPLMPTRAALNQSRRISDRSARNARTLFGFSVGAFGLYDSNFLSSQTHKQGEPGIVLSPRGYFNLGRRKSVLHLDYQFAFRRYPNQSEFDARNHEGGIEYVYLATRKLSFLLRDSGRMGPNDILSLTAGAGLIPLADESHMNQQLFFDQQRMWSNSASAGMNYQSSRNNSYSMTSDYYIARYRSSPGQNTDRISARVTNRRQITKNLTLNIHASNEWTNSADHLRDGKILRLQGGVSYRLGRNWEISGGSGWERVSLDTGEGSFPGYETSVARLTPSNRIEVRYWRQSNFQFGLSGLNRNDTIEATFNQMIGSRTSFQLLAHYYRTGNVYVYGSIQTIASSAGIEYAPHPSFVISVMAHYLHQMQDKAPVITDQPNVLPGGLVILGQPAYVIIPGLNLQIDRYIVQAGITYLFPSARR